MIFGRKKRQSADELPESPVTPLEDELDPAVEVDDETDSDDHETGDAESDGTETDDAGIEDDEDAEPVDHDLRDDGPFDITEVDLDADEVDRLDFGSLILTPFEGMQVQLQLDQETNQVQSALVMADQSALEVALFAAPAASSMVREVLDQMVVNTAEQDGVSEVVEGPFGAELRREIPVTAEDGQQGVHISRTWLAQGPRWLLRGVLMGEAALLDGPAEDTAELLLEFYRNIVVRRHDSPMVPGDVIVMTLPESMVPEAQG